jgi:hypothetical protein
LGSEKEGGLHGVQSGEKDRQSGHQEVSDTVFGDHEKLKVPKITGRGGTVLVDNLRAE